MPLSASKREQQPVTQVAHPLAGRGVEDGAAVQDRLDLLRQQQRRAAAPAVAAHPHQRRRARASSGRPGAPAARGPARDAVPRASAARRPAPRTPPPANGRTRSPPPGGLPTSPPTDRPSGATSACSTVRPLRSHDRNPDTAGTPTSVHRSVSPRCSRKRPPLGQRRGIAAHRVRRPQVPVRLQPLLDRRHRPVTAVDHRPGARPARRAGPPSSAPSLSFHLVEELPLIARKRRWQDQNTRSLMTWMRASQEPVITAGTGKPHTLVAPRAHRGHRRAPGAATSPPPIWSRRCTGAWPTTPSAGSSTPCCATIW